MADVVTELPPKGVFLSYSTADRPAALKLKNGLERFGVAVKIDSETVELGQQFCDFIRDSIRTTGATVVVVSENSLLSDWVALEVSVSLMDRDLWNKRAFVACYLDEGFLDDGFQLRATQTISEKIDKLEALARAHAEQKIDTNALDAKKRRLYKLKSVLGELLGHLRETLCLDIREQGFDTNLQRLVEKLHPFAPGKAAPLTAASDIGKRQQEIDSAIENGDGERALKRIMDFVRDFSGDKRLERKIVLIVGNFRELKATQGRSLQEVREERTRILGEGLEVLDETIAAMSRKVA